ncbi:hypothetical protein DYBT9275_00028 [Dyadobacter sp. CECT 9275]|uniref:Tail specific protease domain-containing protein n=1 Tax=Dyadobacter helix TaxID=2822344 RepID=A0A916J6M7_9BACT|nr:S41 family peptidase [Dyadobacter sp. CECT 9275]CAG4988207.1 hypothetical protein DYBT9275_00028 [Dyadobacter sp. CECT 9275]
MNFKTLLKISVLVLVIWGCKDKTVDPATDAETNQWIYSQMKYWYYWNDKITATPDLTKAPADLFNSLLYKYDANLRPDGDRFSWIQKSADELQASLSGSGKTPGMEYKLLYYPSGTSNVIAVVTYTLPGSPAEKAGFKRGDIFTSVNNQQLTGANYSQLLNAEGTKTYTLAKVDSGGKVTEGTVKREVVPVVLQENPVYFDTLFQFNGTQIGYIVYHQFIPEPYQSKTLQYDKELDQIVGSFKEKNVSSIILDLRYNPGGYVSSATSLASLLVKATTNDIFFYKEYNPTATTALKKQYGEGYFYDKFTAKTQNIGSTLNNLVILTSSRTASASELLINGLKPFMNVILVGDNTVGKNVGSITLSNKKDGITWGLQPIVSKSFNGLHKSDYSVGFTPDVRATEGILLYPYGDLRDPLLSEALFKILGSRVVRRIPLAETKLFSGVEIMSSVSRKAGGSNMFFSH